MTDKLRDEFSANVCSACFKGDLTALQTLIGINGDDLNNVNRNGRIPLHLACERGHTDIVKMLLFNGSDVDKLDHEGNTPLHAAVVSRKTAIANLLIESNCSIDLVNNFGQCPLNIAVKGLDVPMVQFLLRSGAHIGSIDGTQSLLKDFLENFKEIPSWNLNGRRWHICGGYIFPSPQVYNSPVLNILIRAGYDVNRDREVQPLEAYLNSFPFDTKMAERNKELLTWLQWVSRQPQSLQQICRLKVRVALKFQIPIKIKKLKLPQRLKDYLNFYDLNEEEI